MIRGYRVWHKEKEEYINGYDVVLRHDGLVISRYALGALNTDMPVNVIIEQSTGLKDKNGIEIYEGDIVKMVCRVAKDESTLYKVVWDDFLTGYDLINLEPSKADVGYLNKYNIKEHFKVIGNIHEPPKGFRPEHLKRMGVTIMKGDEE